MAFPDPCEHEASELLLSAVHLLARAHPRISRDIIREAAAEAVCRYLERRQSRVNIPLYPAAWIHRVGTNILRAEYRRQKRLCRTDPADGTSLVERIRCECEADELAGTIRMRLLVATLGARLSATVWMHGVEGRKPAEIAEIEGCDVQAIYTRLKRAHKLLRGMLAAEFSGTRKVRLGGID